MSQQVHWKPIVSVKNRIDGISLKNILVAEFPGYSFHAPDEGLPLDCSHVEFLCGLRAAHVEGAKELYDALICHKKIIVWIE